MSNIITKIDDFKKLSFYLKYIENNLIDEDLISDILKFIIPKQDGKLLVGYELDKNSINKNVAEFNQIYNIITIRMKEIVEYIELQYINICSDLKIEQSNLRAYILLLTLLHEVEHSKQYMICLGKVDSPYKIVKSGYNICFHTLLTIPKISLLSPKRYFEDKKRKETYMRNSDEYLIERNATLEASLILRDLACYEDDTIAYKVMDFIHKSQCLIGYENNGLGDIEKTFRDLLYLKKYDELKGENVEYSDKVRFGFELNKDELNELNNECSKTYKKMFN